MKIYTAVEISKLLKVERYKITDLSTKGTSRYRFTPHCSADGQGNRAIYTEKDFKAIKKFFELKKQLKDHEDYMRRLNK